MGERTAEGYAPGGTLEPNPVGKPDPHEIDSQITEMVINRLRDGIGFPPEVRTIFEVIKWVTEHFAVLVQEARSKPAEQLYAAAGGGTSHPDFPATLDGAYRHLQAEEGVDPDGFHRRDAAALDERHTQIIAGTSAPYPSDPGTAADDAASPARRKTTRHDTPPTLTDPGDFLQALLATSDLDAPSAFDILGVCMELAIFLMGKNKQYGDSALNPVRIMSSADPSEQLRVRMDDKLSRMFRGDKANEDEDVFKDLVGYWVLMRVAEKRAGG